MLFFSKNGLTPLHIAAHYGHVDIAELLLNRGADTDARARVSWLLSNLRHISFQKSRSREHRIEHRREITNALSCVHALEPNDNYILWCSQTSEDMANLTVFSQLCYFT